MKKFFIVSVFVIASASAMAQNAQPQDNPYVSWEFNQGDAQTLGQALGEIPAKYSLPLINYFAQKEQLAVKRKELDVKPAPKPAPSPDAPKADGN